ncbi:MAG TPA: ion channel [Thermomicrobiales bacterium]|nr:ion channel [Thermomicrobiales bacterium]
MDEPDVRRAGRRQRRPRIDAASLSPSAPAAPDDAVAPSPADEGAPTALRAWVDRHPRLARADELSDAALTVLAILLAPLVLIPFEVVLPGGLGQGLIWTGYGIWSVFVLHLLWRLALTADRAAYLRAHWLDAAIVVAPILQIPFGPETGRIWWAMIAAVRGLVGVRGAFKSQGLIYILAVLAVLVGSAADLVYQAEKASPKATITSYGDALWWTFVTMSSTGYGDKYPVTAAGRTIGVGLMVMGIAVFGLVTAKLAQFFVEAEEGLTRTDLDSRLQRLESALGMQVQRQKDLADKAMRIARRTKTRQNKQRSQANNRGSRNGREAADAGKSRDGGQRSSRSAKSAAPATDGGAMDPAATAQAAKAERRADRHANRGAPAANATATGRRLGRQATSKEERRGDKAERKAERRAGRHDATALEAGERVPAPTPLPVPPPPPRLTAVPAAYLAAETPNPRPRRSAGSRPRVGGGSNVGRRAASGSDAA